MQSHEHSSQDQPKTISIKLPRLRLPSLQAFVLILLIAVGLLQTAQLYGLSVKIASAQVGVGASTGTSAPAASASSVTSSLPDMVGGC